MKRPYLEGEMETIGRPEALDPRLTIDRCAEIEALQKEVSRLKEMLDKYKDANERLRSDLEMARVGWRPLRD